MAGSNPVLSVCSEKMDTDPDLITILLAGLKQGHHPGSYNIKELDSLPVPVQDCFNLQQDIG